MLRVDVVHDVSVSAGAVAEGVLFVLDVVDDDGVVKYAKSRNGLSIM